MMVVMAEPAKLGESIGRGESRAWKPKSGQKKVRLNCWVDADWYAELKELAKLEGKTITDLVIETLGTLLIADDD